MEETFRAFEDLVRTHAARLNLVGPGELDHFRQRHVEDSLRLLPHLASAPEGPVVDVGSGAGLPGIPLAIAVPERSFRLLEPRRKRAAFLEEAARALGLSNIQIVPATAAEMHDHPGWGGAHAAAVARALAPPAQAFDLLLPFVAPGGVAILLVGERAEIPAAADFASEGVAIVRRDRAAERE